MKINDEYEISIVIIELLDDGTTGGIYTDMREFKKYHPTSKFKYGYVIINTTSKCILAECNDYNDTPEEAMQDYMNHVESNKTDK